MTMIHWCSKSIDNPTSEKTMHRESFVKTYISSSDFLNYAFPLESWTILDSQQKNCELQVKTVYCIPFVLRSPPSLVSVTTKNLQHFIIIE